MQPCFPLTAKLVDFVTLTDGIWSVLTISFIQLRNVNTQNIYVHMDWVSPCLKRALL